MNSPRQDLKHIQNVILNRLKAEGYDDVDLVAIPNHSDRPTQIRTLEEVLKDFDQSPEKAEQSYLVRVRRTLPAIETPETQDSVYLPDGSLNTGYLLKTADLLFCAGDYSLARNVYGSLLKASDKQGVANYWLGRCFECEGTRHLAMQHYREAVTFEPMQDAYWRLADLLSLDSKTQEAAEVLERALLIRDLSENDRLEILERAGKLWAMAKFHDSARECFTRALALDPQLDRLWVKLGEVEIEAQRPPAAQVAFERALALNSQNDAALAGLGNIAYRAGEKRAAHDYFARSLSINIHNPGAVFCLVKCAYETKNYAIAARFLEQYAQSAPINANLLYSLAGLHYHLGRMEQAGALAAQILELKPDHEGAKELLQLIGKLSVMEDRCQSTQIP